MQHPDAEPEPAEAQVTDEAMALRFLAMTDRILGLEAELAEARYRADMAQLGQRAALEREADLAAFIVTLQRSPTWRAGTVIGLPVRALRRLSNWPPARAGKRSTKR